MVRAAALHRMGFSYENAISNGLQLRECHLNGIKVGAVRGRNTSRAPAASITCQAVADLWVGRLSITTMSPGRQRQDQDLFD